jgi:hypothetical protein
VFESCLALVRAQCQLFGFLNLQFRKLRHPCLNYYLAMVVH